MASCRSARLKLIANVGRGAGAVGAGGDAAATSLAASSDCESGSTESLIVALGDSDEEIPGKTNSVSAGIESNEASSWDSSSEEVRSGDAPSVALIPNAAASLKRFSATAASDSGAAGGATPINSSSLAIRYPSSLRLPMIISTAS